MRLRHLLITSLYVILFLQHERNQVSTHFRTESSMFYLFYFLYILFHLSTKAFIDILVCDMQNAYSRKSDGSSIA